MMHPENARILCVKESGVSSIERGSKWRVVESEESHRLCGPENRLGLHTVEQLDLSEPTHQVKYTELPLAVFLRRAATNQD